MADESYSKYYTLMKTSFFSKTLRAILLGLGLFACSSAYVLAQNPYVPLWEHLPDGEPRVFEDPDHPGKYRAYIIGSHDVRYDSYCGPDIHAWSAPVEDLNNWTDEGPIFTYFVDNQWDVMYAPDLVEIIRNGKKIYILYPHSRGANREAMVCIGERPDGPFIPLNLTKDGTKTVEGSTMGFDPSVFVEKITDPSDPDYEIGFRAYGFWGFQRSSAAQLDQKTMYSVRPGTEVIPYFIPASQSYGHVREIPGVTYPALYKDQKLEDFNFFEASSIRQVGNKYVWVFSGHSGPDYGVGSSNSTLRYAYGDSPMGPWRSGGVLVDSRAIVPNEDGSHLKDSFSGHNTHGSLLQINDQWYVFYHRAPRGFGNARQPMVAPVTIQWDEKPVAEGGKVVIKGYDPYSADNTWTAKASDGFEYTGAEVTSEGFNIFGLDPYKYYSAGYACYMSDFSLMQDTHDIWGSAMDVTNVKNGDILGFKYFGFGGLKTAQKGLKPFEGTKAGNKTAINVFATPRTDKAFKIIVMMDGPWSNAAWNGKKIAEINVPAGSARKVTKFTADVAKSVDGIGGKHAIYIIGEGADGVLFDLQGLGFSSKSKKISYPVTPSVTVKVGNDVIDFGKSPKFSTNANGIVFLDTFEKYITVTADQDTKVTASSDNKKVKFTITQPEGHTGDAAIEASYNGMVKKYIIHIKDREPLYKEKEVLVAKDFEIRQIDEHTWHGNGHRVYNESFYIIEGENRALLIDCGTSLEDLNKAVAQITDKPVTLIATHVHGDHTGSAVNYYREIYINAADMVNAQTQLSDYRGRINYLTDGQIIDLGGRQIEVMFTPGHTPGSTTFFDKAAGYGFSGDAFGSTNLLLSTNFPTLYNTASRTLEYMQKNGIEKLYSGHYHGNDTESVKRVADIKQMAREMIDGTYKGEIFNGSGNLDKYITNGEVKINFSSKTPVLDLTPRSPFGRRN